MNDVPEPRMEHELFIPTWSRYKNTFPRGRNGQETKWNADIVQNINELTFLLQTINMEIFIKITCKNSLSSALEFKIRKAIIKLYIVRQMNDREKSLLFFFIIISGTLF